MKILVWDVRTEKRMSTRELAQLSGVSKSEISNIENGKHMPTVDTLCKLAKALEVKPEELFRC